MQTQIKQIDRIDAQPRHKKGWLLAALLTGQFMANIDIAVVNVATPSIHASLHASGGAMELVVSGYVLAYAMLLVTGARLGDTHGYRRLFLTGLGVFTLASLACGLAPNAPVLIAVRVIQGIGAALMVPQVLNGIQLNFAAGPERARAIGWYAMALSGGAIAGQALGGALIAANLFGSGWRPIFLVNVPIGVVLLIVARRWLPADRSGQVKPLDLWGVATLAVALLLVVVPLALGRDLGWPAWTWLCLAVSPLAFGVFVAVERRVAVRGGYPLINLHILTRPAVAWGLIAYSASTSTYYALLFTLALYLQRGLGWSPLSSGLALVSWVTAFGITGPLLPRMRLSARVTLLIAPAGYLILAGGYLGLSLSLLTNHLSTALLIVLLGIGGFGLGAGFAPMIAHLTASVPSRYAPDISGLIATAAQMAAVIGIASFGTAYLNLAPEPGAQSATYAFMRITAWFGLAALVAMLSAYQSTRRRVERRARRQGSDTDTASKALPL